MSHQCNFRCGDHTHYDIAICAEDIGEEEYIQRIANLYELQGVRLIHVKKLLEWDKESILASNTALHGAFVDHNGNIKVGSMVIEPKAVFGITVATIRG